MLRKWAPIWIPSTFVFTISTLVINSRSIREQVELYFPSYVQLLRENYGFDDEDKKQREFLIAASQYQNRPQNILVHSAKGGIEKVRVDGSTSARDIELKDTTTLLSNQNVFLQPDMLEVEDEGSEEYGLGAHIQARTSEPSVSCIDSELSRRERLFDSNHNDQKREENIEEMDTILQNSVWGASIGTTKRVDSGRGNKELEEEGSEDTSIDRKKQYYIPSQTYTGKKDGYVFTTRDNGVGYYVDTKPQLWNITKTAVVLKMRQNCVKFFLDGITIMNNEGRKLNGHEIKERRTLEKLQHKLDYHIREKNIGLRISDDCERDIKNTKDEMNKVKRKLGFSFW